MNYNKFAIHPLGHDSTIAFIDHKNKNIFCLTLERFTRFKHDYRFLKDLLKEYNNLIAPNSKMVVSIDEVSEYRIRFFDALYEQQRIGKKIKNANMAKNLKGFLLRKILKLFYLPTIRKSKKILNQKGLYTDHKSFLEAFPKDISDKISSHSFYDHHFSHACSAYYFAPQNFKNDCIIVTIDGQGDGYFSKIFEIKNNKPVYTCGSKDAASLPLLYSIFTAISGFTPAADEGKVEALACYGKSATNNLYEILSKTFAINDNLEIIINENKDFPFDDISKNYGEIQKYFNENFYQKMKPADFAADMQIFFEEFFLQYLKKIRDKFGKNKAAFAGGAFANIKLNLRVFEDKIFDEFYIFPAMGDEGTSIGALAYDDCNSGIDVDWLREIKMPYFGTKYSKEEVEKVLNQNKSKINYEYLGDESYKKLALHIKENKVCALFQGRMEFGPRALGHRSILANPRNKNVRDEINTKFKKREIFQPFCPSILEDERDRLFKESYPNKHMTCAFRVKDEFCDKIPAIVHVDGTARPQFVTKEDDEYFFNLLTELKRINDFGVTLNTSFNLHGRAIVMKPQDALDDFFSCNIDYLFMENFMISRKK